MSDFRSDNVASAAPEILDAVVAAGQGSASPYGEDEISARLDGRFSALFETEVRVFPVVTGTAANAIAVSVRSPITTRRTVGHVGRQRVVRGAVELAERPPI